MTRDESQNLAAFLKLLAHPSRLSIVSLLRRGQRTVAEIESTLGLRQPSLSQQLGVLREGGLINAHRTSKSVAYALAVDRLEPMLTLLLQQLEIVGQDQLTSADERSFGEPPSQAAVFASVSRTHEG